VAKGDAILAKWVVEMRLGRLRQQIDAELQNRKTIDQIIIVTQPTPPDRQELIDSMRLLDGEGGVS
jgi:hypothetical protein